MSARTFRRNAPRFAKGTWRLFALLGAAALVAAVVGFLVLRAAAAAPATYTDYDTNGDPFTVTLPQGNDSFADAFDNLNRNGDTQAGTTGGALATGTPNEADPTGIPTQSVSLGDGGSIILRFTDNALTGSGNSNPDIYVFETGSNTELVDIYVAPGSPTAACPAATDPSYRYVGQTTKSYGGVDIDDDGLGLTDRLYCARIVDVLNDVNNTSNGYNGAEIDAVGAIETVLLNDAPVNTVPGAQTTNEDAARAFNTANANRITVADRDAGTNPVRVTLTATNGTLTPGATTTGVTVAGGGTSTLTLTGPVTNVNTALNGLTFTPTANYSGAATLIVTTNDQGNTGEGGPKEDVDTVNITVSPINDAPVNLVPAAQTTNENTALVFNTANGNRLSTSDVDAAAAMVQVRLRSASGTATLSQTTGLTFQSGSNGTNDFTVRGTLANLTAALDGLRYNPTTNFAGAGSVRITTSDLGNTGTGGALTDDDTVAVTVNDNPTITTVTNNGPRGEGTPVTITVTATDPDSAAGDRRYQFDCNNDGDYADAGDVGPQAANTAQCTFPDNGTSRVNVRVTDGEGGSADGFTSVTVTNVAPDAVNDAANAVEDGPDVTIDVLANDADVPADPRTITGNTQPAAGQGAVTCSATQCAFDPSADFNGTTTFQYTISDGDGGTDTAIVTVTLAPANDRPTATANPAGFTVDEDAAARTVTLTGSDVETGAAQLVFTFTQTPTKGTLRQNGNVLNAGSTFTGSPKDVTYTPDADAGGADSFEFKVTDRGDPDNCGAAGATCAAPRDSVVVNVPVTITPVNDKPVIDLNGGAAGTGYNAAFTEDAGAVAIVDAVNPDALTVSDVDDTNMESATVTLANLPDGAAESLDANVGTTGITKSYTPATGVLTLTGSATKAQYEQVLRTVTYNNTSQDLSTANRTVNFVINDGSDDSNTATSTVSVNAANDAPAISDIANRTILEDTDTGDIEFIVSDPDGSSGDLTITGSSSNQTLVPDANVTFGGTGGSRTVKVTPAPNRFGGPPATITVTVSDGTGPGSQTATETFELTVTPVNDAPSFTKGADQTVAEDAGAQSVPDWATGISEGPFEDQDVSFLVTNDNNALFSAQPAVSPDGALTYTPAANANGTAVVTVRAEDDGGTANDGADTSAPQTFTINVDAVNDAPVASDDSRTINEDAPPLTVDLAGLVSDAETTNENLAYEIVSGPTGAQGTLTQTGSSFTFDSADDFNGAVEVAYKVRDRGDPDDCGAPNANSCDAPEESAAKTVTINVTPVNDAPVAQDQTLTPDEGATPTVTLIGADRDGDDLTYEVTRLPGNGKLYDGAQATGDPIVLVDGEPFVLGTDKVTYVPDDPDFDGDDDFGFVADDGQADSAPATITLDYVPVNDAPVVTFTNAGDAQTANEGERKTYDYAVTDVDGPSDPDVTESCGDASAVYEDTNAPNSFECLFPDGPETHTVSVEADDGESDNNTGSDSVEVTVDNVKPTVVLAGPTAVEESTTEERAYSFTVSDPGADTFTVDEPDFPACGQNGSLVDGSLDTDAAGGSFECLFEDGGPANNPTTSNVEIRVKDSDGAADTDGQPVRIVTQVDNAAPSATFDAPASVDEGDDVGLSLSGVTDPADDNDSHEYRFQCGDDAWTDYGDEDTHVCPTTDDGEIVVRGQVRDEDGGESEPYQKTVTVNNVDPTATLSNDGPRPEGSPVEVSFSEQSDPSGADRDSLRYAYECDNGSLAGATYADASTDATKECTYDDDGEKTVRARVIDKDGGFTEYTTTFQVTNADPVADDQTVETEEDVEETVTLTASDPGNDPPTFTVTRLPDNGRLYYDANGQREEITTASPEDPFVLPGAELFYVPNEDYNNTPDTLDSFGFEVTDGDGGFDTGTVRVRVTPVDDTPVANDDGPISVQEDDGDGEAVDVLGNDESLGDGVDEILVTRQPAKGTVACDANGCTYTPNADATGDDSFEYKVKDGNGTESNAATVSINIPNQNDAPVAEDDARTIDENDTAILNVLSNDRDADLPADDLDIDGVGQGANGGMVSCDEETGECTYTPPSADFFGSDTFTYTAKDAAGAESNQATVTITVNNVPDGPVADPKTVTTEEEKPADVTLRGDDADGDDVTFEIVDGPGKGALSGIGDVTCEGTTPETCRANVTYMPNANVEGPATDGFTYRVCDDDGCSEPVTVEITITEVNDRPVADDDEYGTPEDEALTVNAEDGVLNGDRDPNAGGNGGLRAELVPDSGPANGTLTLRADGSFDYEPGDDFTGTDRFEYQACDAQDVCSDPATVEIRVREINDPPVNTVPGEQTTPEDTPLVFSDADGNGISTTDPDSGAGTVTVTLTAEKGTLDLGNGQRRAAAVGAVDVVAADRALTLSGNVGDINAALGGLTFIPDPDYVGPASVEIRTNDGANTGEGPAEGLEDADTVPINVTAVNDPPAPENDEVTVRGGGPVTVDVLANDADPEGKGTLDPASVKIVNGQGPSNGTVSVDPATGRITYTPNAGFVGEDGFTYEVCDTATPAMCNTATVTVRTEAAAPRADLELRADAPNQVRVGKKFAYNVTVVNHGPDAARNVVMTSVLPSGVKFVSAKGCAYNATTRTVTCTLGDMADEATKVMKITVKATKAGNLALGGCAVKSDTVDPQSADNRQAAGADATSATGP